MLAQKYFGWKTALALECCVMGCRVYTGRWEIGDGDITRIVETGRLFIYFTWHQKQVSTWLGIAVRTI